jgi:hypothetical protein
MDIICAVELNILEKSIVRINIVYLRQIIKLKAVGDAYLEPNPLEGEIKEDRNSGGRMG